MKKSGFEQLALEDGDLWIHERFFSSDQALVYLTALIDEIEWTQPMVRFGARTVPSPRLAAWHGDRDAVYTYSGITNRPSPWNSTLQEIRARLEDAVGSGFNSVLLNYYRSGQDSMGWHRDNERELGPEPLIASISLGENRRFLMRHEKDRTLRWSTELENGSALIMLGKTQTFWRHCLPKSKTRNNPRINLTFRQVFQDMQ